MDQSVRELVDAVPADYRSPVSTKHLDESKGERLLGPLESLPDDSRAILRARDYYLRRLFAEQRAHEAAHAQPGYTAEARAQRTARRERFADAFNILTAASATCIYEHFGLDRDMENVGERAEGIFARPALPGQVPMPEHTSPDQRIDGGVGAMAALLAMATGRPVYIVASLRNPAREG